MDLLLNPAVATEFVNKINMAWRKTTEAILEVSRLLNEAKHRVPPGHFTEMVKSRLPFGERMAERLMLISQNPVLSDPSHVTVLPPAITTLSILSSIPAKELAARIKDGTISPSMERQHAEKLVREYGPVNGARAIAHNRIEPDDSDNFFPTPPWGTRALFVHVFTEMQIHEFKSVWEPACGEGHMAEVLHEYFERMGASDIRDYGYSKAPLADFLHPKLKGPDADWIITNPPFGDATIPFIQRALERSNVGVAMFVRSQWLTEGVERYEQLFRDRPPTLCAFFTERVNLCKGRWDPMGSTATAYAWAVWVHGAQPLPTFWIPPGCRERLSAPDDVERFTKHPVLAREQASVAA